MNNIINKIRSIKEDLGAKLLILTHHYQRKEIVDLDDYKGDSFGLSQTAVADDTARFIVFCGVHFMAESAEILSQSHQTVQLPDMFKINPENLLQTLENIGRTNVVHVSESIKADAKIALDRMLALVS